MDSRAEHVLSEFEYGQAGEDKRLNTMNAAELESRRNDFNLTVGRATGILLNLLAQESRAQRILELGKSAGYSTIWLADAARSTAGIVRTVDIDAARQQRARVTLERAGLHEYVVFHVDDAVSFIRRSPDRFDFVLLDTWKDSYVPCVDALLGRLLPGAIIVADNMTKPLHARLAGRRYLAHVINMPHWQTIELPIGNGVAISRHL